VPWFIPELKPLLAIAIATLQENGTLIEANAGFIRLIRAEGRQAIGEPAAQFFQQPEFSALVRAPSGADGLIHDGLLTIGSNTGQTRSLKARVWRVAGQLRVLAEHDIDELERLYDSLLDLNQQYADAQLALAQTNLKLQQREAQIVEMSLTDMLTGVGNRRRLEQALTLETGRASRTDGKLCAVMADLDHFKLVNDTYGHEAGDKVLAGFGEVLRQHTRATDIVARFGGEEFVVLMPHTELADAVATAERIRMAFAICRFDPLIQPVTASFGAVELAAGEQGDALLHRADVALYSAKQQGRNRVVAGLAVKKPVQAMGDPADSGPLPL
jgi:two-component system cell cycle response regulator